MSTEHSAPEGALADLATEIDYCELETRLRCRSNRIRRDGTNVEVPDDDCIAAAAAIATLRATLAKVNARASTHVMSLSELKTVLGDIRQIIARAALD